MKTFVLILFSALYTITFAADINVKTQIKEVTVYTTSAQVKATADANLVKGTYNLVFQNVSQFIDENSIQIKGNADFTILSIVVKKDFLNEDFKDASLLKLEDSLASLKLKMAKIQNYIAALKDELGMLKANQKIGGANTNLTSIELEKMASFVRSRTEEANNKITDQNVVVEKVNNRISEIQNQINTYNAENNKNKADIVVAIKSNAIVKADLDLSYNVGNAGWSPFYDIKAESVSNPVVITSKANVWQNTGEEWKDVKLFISTGNPTISMNIPALNPFYVNVQSEQVVTYQKNNNRNKYAGAAPMMQAGTFQMNEGGAVSIRGGRSNEERVNKDFINSNSSNFTTNTESQTNNIFEISIPYTIKSDGEQNLVGIQKYEVPATYNYISKPKIEPGAFLEAKLIDWNQSGLLPGDANIFFEGTYIGKTYFETNVANDTISISFGRDNNIVVDRKRTKFLNDKSLIGSTKSVAFEYEINIKNKKKTAIDITIDDQIPLSANTNTEVELNEGSKADYVKETGSLKWKSTIKAGESTTHKFGFKVRYPKGFKITNLN